MANTFKVRIEADKATPATDPVHFSIGNPSVEHITGVLHLYKSKSTETGEVWSAPCGGGVFDTVAGLVAQALHVASQALASGFW